MEIPAPVSLPNRPDVAAPDGSEVRLLAAGARGGMAAFDLAPGQVARAVRHRTVEEIWFVAEGRGRIWMQEKPGQERIVDLTPGLSLAIPTGVSFQFRNDGEARLRVIGVTMPPWPGAGEAEFVDGRWPATAAANE